jgi:hypothetical protein
MAEATDITVTQLQSYAGKSELLVEATSTATETITLDGSKNNENVNTILAVTAHVKSTGVPVTYAYATNVLTRTTAGTDVEDVIRVIYE